MISKYPDDLTCDMAETYGIFDIKRVPAKLLATLAVGLRDNSRVKMKMSGAKVPDNILLLAHIADVIRWIRWAMTEDGANNVNLPSSLVNLYYGIEPEDTVRGYDTPEEYEAARRRIIEGT